MASLWERIKGRFATRPPGTALATTAPEPSEVDKRIDSITLARFLSVMKERPQIVLPGRWANRPLFKGWDEFRWTNNVLHGKATWAYICMKRNANAIASVPWVVQVREGDVWTADPDHPLQLLLDRPNPQWTGIHLRKLVAFEMYLTGNSLMCQLPFDSPIPLELWTIPPHLIKAIPTKAEGPIIKAYEVTREDSTKFEVDAAAIIHLMFPDPTNPWWGLSPIRAAMRDIEMEDSASEWQKRTYDNLMIPPLIFTVGSNQGDLGGLGHIGKEQFEELKKTWKKEYQGAINARTPMVTGQEMKVERLSLTPQEVDFLKSREMTVQTICAVLGVPQPVAGVLVDATYTNIRTAREIWWEDTIMPFLDGWGAVINTQLAPKFGDNVRAVPDTAGVSALQPALLRKLEMMKSLWSMGYPANELNQFLRLGLPEISGGDVGYLPANLLPIGSMDTMDPLDDE